MVVLAVDVFQVDLGAMHLVPGLPGDPEDRQRYHQANDRVGDLSAERDKDRRARDAEGDEASTRA